MEIIQDGLIFNLNGVHNGEEGAHDSSSPLWLDQTNQGYNATINNMTNGLWAVDGLSLARFTYATYATFSQRLPEDLQTFTLQVCFENYKIVQSSGTTVNNVVFTNGNCAIFHQGPKVTAYVDIDGSRYEFIGDTYSIEEKNFYTLKYDGEYIYFYKNLIVLNKKKVTIKDSLVSKPGSDSTGMYLGRGQNGSTEFYGKIYSCIFYNKSLTDKEIKNNIEYIEDTIAYTQQWTCADCPVFEGPGHINWNFSKLYSNKSIMFAFYNSDRTDAYKYSFMSLSNTASGMAFYTPGENKNIYYDSYKYGYYRDTPQAGGFAYKGHTWFYGRHADLYYNDVPSNFYLIPKDKLHTNNYETAARWIIDNILIFYDAERPIDTATNRIKYVKVKEDDGTYSDAILLAVDALNVDFSDGETLIQKLAKKAEKKIYSDEGINIGRKIDSEQGTLTNAFGNINSIPGDYGVAEGQNNIIYGQFGHTEGQENIINATTEYGHAEGYKNQVNGNYGHAEGQENTVSGIGAHVEGLRNAATGDYSHAQGQNNVASGVAAAVMGEDTTAEGIASLAIGKGTTAKGNYSFVHGKYNSTKNYDRYAEIVGGGETSEAGDNIYTLDWQGNAKFKGNLTAELFNGKATKDIKGRNLTTYIRDLSAEKNELTLIRGDGTEKTVTLRGWQNVQEKYNSLTNENAIIVGKSPVEIITMEYMNETDQIGNAIFQSTIIVYADVDINQTHAIVKFDIKIDDLSVDNGLFIPTETLCKGYHIINLMYPVMNISLKEVHIITVDATCVTGNIAIGKNNIKTVFYGMGINSGKTRWDGRIDVSDTFEGFNLNKRLIQKSLEIGELFTVDNILVETQIPQLSDSIFKESFEAFTLNKRTNRKSINVNNETLFNPVLTVAPVILFYSLNIDKIGYLLFNQNYIKISSDETKFILNDSYSILSVDYGEIGSGYLTSLDLSLIDNINTINTIEIKEENLE